MDDAADRVSASIPGNEELSKLLKRLGYPEIQEATRPSTLLSKAIAAVKKRMTKLDEIMKSLSPTLPKRRPEDQTDEKELDLPTRTGL